MRKCLTGLSVGVLLALGLSAPALARDADPITFSFTDHCGRVDTTVTNNTTEPIMYTLATTIKDVADPLGVLEFSLAGGQARTHSWVLLSYHGMRATSPALNAPVYAVLLPNCVNPLLAPHFLLDCDGQGLGQAKIDYPNVGNPVFALNGVGKPFPPRTAHFELFSGMKVGDKVSFQVPALSDLHEMVTWHEWTYQILPKCAVSPEVTVTPTCTGINIKTVNNQQASFLHVTSPSGDVYPVAQGQALNLDVPMSSGRIVIIVWEQPWNHDVSETPAAALLEYVRPQSCDNSPPPANGGGQLPKTGAPTWMLMSAGGLLLVLGFVLFVLTRERRREPVA